MDTLPESIAVAAGGRLLRLTMSGGTKIEIEAAPLRAACNCAACRRAKIEGRFPQTDAGVTITTVEAIGQYAISIRFSDGHDRGIYPWRYLADLASGRTAPEAAWTDD